MIAKIILKFGKAHGLNPAFIDVAPVTVFVGPNNSGKSKILREISQFCRFGKKSNPTLILESMEFQKFSRDSALKELNMIALDPIENEMSHADNIIIQDGNRRRQFSKEQFISALQSPNDNLRTFCEWYLRFYTIILNGKNRMGLTSKQSSGNFQNPISSFQILFCDNKKRKEVRRIIHEAFGSYFVLDCTEGGNLKIRLSNTSPENDEKERSLTNEAIKFYSQALSIENTSDGVQAFTGIIVEIIAGDPKILLIDEPEAFLHPTLSYNLAKEIARASEGTNKRIFASTHSSSFVMGCIQAGVPVNIVRLTYKNNVATARVLPNNDVLKLMRNPLLRSTGVLEGIFYEYVVVTESDTDRAFYQEVNERLLQFKPEWGIQNCLFVNAQNWQTVRTIIKPLRELGIPTACIVDVDIIKRGGQEWSNFLSSGFIPEIGRSSLADARSKIKNKFDELKKNMKKEGGVSLLSENDKAAANDLFDQISEYGLFVVRNGEVESWLKELDISGHGPLWLTQVFEKMGEDPKSEKYVKPSDGDVWVFINKLKVWFDDQNRKGIPIQENS